MLQMLEVDSIHFAQGVIRTHGPKHDQATSPRCTRLIRSLDRRDEESRLALSEAENQLTKRSSSELAASIYALNMVASNMRPFVPEQRFKLVWRKP